MKRVAILISGGGSNMLRLVQDMQGGDHPAQPVLVASNDPNAAGLAKAAALGVPTAAVDHRAYPGHRAAFEAALLEPLLRARQGTALFFDDPRAGQPFFGAYGATKAAQIAFARSWQAENQRLGPRVVIATPNPMPTSVRARFFPGEDRSTLSPCRAEADRILAELAI